MITRAKTSYSNDFQKARLSRVSKTWSITLNEANADYPQRKLSIIRLPEEEVWLLLFGTAKSTKHTGEGNDWADGGEIWKDLV